MLAFIFAYTFTFTVHTYFLYDFKLLSSVFSFQGERLHFQPYRTSVLILSLSTIICLKCLRFTLISEVQCFGYRVLIFLL